MYKLLLHRFLHLLEEKKIEYGFSHSLPQRIQRFFSKHGAQPCTRVLYNFSCTRVPIKEQAGSFFQTWCTPCTHDSHEFFRILTAHEFYSKNKYYKWLKEQVYLRQIITEISRDPINIIASQCLIKGWRYKWSRFIQMP